MAHIQLNMHLIIYSKHLFNYSLKEKKEKTPLEVFNMMKTWISGGRFRTLLWLLPQRLSGSPKDLRVSQPCSLTCIFEVTHVSCLTEEGLGWTSLPNLTKPQFSYLENGDNNTSTYSIWLKIRWDTVSRVLNVMLGRCPLSMSSKVNAKY